METKNSRSKKGNAVLDTFFVLIVMAVLGITIFFGFKILSQVNQNIQADDSFDSYSKNEINTYTNKTQAVFDNIFLTVFALLWMVSLVASFYIESHPIFFAFSIILLLFVFWIIPIIGNSVETVMIDENIASTVALFPKANWILTHMLTVAIAVGSSILLVMFAKNQNV